MISAEQLDEWERDAKNAAPGPWDIDEAIPALIAEVRRLTVDLADARQNRDRKWEEAKKERERANEAVAVMHEAQRERDAAFADGLACGREDVAKYSRTVGEIECALGIASAVPMRETVSAVRAVVSERDAMRAVVDAARKARLYTCAVSERYPEHQEDCDCAAAKEMDEALAKLDEVKP